MAGGTLKAVRSGNQGEYLAEFLLASIAYATPVKRQEDIGHDFLCYLCEEDDGNVLKAGPAFTVQIKTNRKSIVYKKPHARAWLANQDTPYFIGVIDLDKSTLELYSTWEALKVYLFYLPTKVKLLLKQNPSTKKSINYAKNKSTVDIYLGQPVLRIKISDVTKRTSRIRLGRRLKEWIAIDSANLTRRAAKMYWVTGPKKYKTNQKLTLKNNTQVNFFWNIKNLKDCVTNFARASTALRLVIDRSRKSGKLKTSTWNKRIIRMEEALKSFKNVLEPAVINFLQKEANVDI